MLVDVVRLGPPCVLVNQRHTVAVHQVVHVALQQQPRPQRLEHLVAQTIPARQPTGSPSVPPPPLHQRQVALRQRGAHLAAVIERPQPLLQELPPLLGQGDEAAPGMDGIVQPGSQVWVVLLRQCPRPLQPAWAGGKAPLQRRVIGLGQEQPCQRLHLLVGLGVGRFQLIRKLADNPLLPSHHLRHGPVGPDGGAAAARGIAGNDHRRERLVDQRMVRLVHDGNGVGQVVVLHPAGVIGLQVVPQVVEPQLPHWAVDDCPPVNVPPLPLFRVLQHRPGTEAQGLVHRCQQLGVAVSQVIVRGDHMNRTAQDGVKRSGKGGSHRLALSGVHLHHPAPGQVNPGQQLLVCSPQPQSPSYRLCNNGEALGQQAVRRRIPRLPLQTREGIPQRGVGVRREAVPSNTGQQSGGTLLPRSHNATRCFFNPALLPPARPRAPARRTRPAAPAGAPGPAGYGCSPPARPP